MDGTDSTGNDNTVDIFIIGGGINDAGIACDADGTARISLDAPLRYLSVQENAAPLNWDVEECRRALAAPGSSPGP